MRFLAGKCSKMRLRLELRPGPRWRSSQRSPRWGALWAPRQRLICRKNSDLGYQLSKQRALVHFVGAILLSTTLPRAIFACSFLNVPDAACSPGHNIVLIICQFATSPPEMHQISPTAIADLKNFPGETPGPPFLRGPPRGGGRGRDEMGGG